MSLQLCSRVFHSSSFFPFLCRYDMYVCIQNKFIHLRANYLCNIFIKIHNNIDTGIMKTLCNRYNLCRLFEVIETYSKYFLIMEHAAAGELFKRLISEGRMHESEAKNIFAQIVLAVKHLVNNRISLVFLL